MCEQSTQLAGDSHAICGQVYKADYFVYTKVLETDTCVWSRSELSPRA